MSMHTHNHAAVAAAPHCCCGLQNRQGRSVSRAAADMGLGFLVASEVVVGAVVARSRDNMAAAAMVFDWA